MLFLFSLIYALLPILGSKVIGFLASLTGANMSLRQSNLENAASSLLGIFGTDNYQDLIWESIKRFVNEPFIILFLISMFALCFVGIFYSKNNNEIDSDNRINNKPAQFVQVIIILGILLCFIPELFYLRDQFGWRMNTIFKFYFQGWIVLSLAAAFSIAEILFRSKTNIKKLISILLIISHFMHRFDLSFFCLAR